MKLMLLLAILFPTSSYAMDNRFMSVALPDGWKTLPVNNEIEVSDTKDIMVLNIQNSTNRYAIKEQCSFLTRKYKSFFPKRNFESTNEAYDKVLQAVEGIKKHLHKNKITFQESAFKVEGSVGHLLTHTDFGIHKEGGVSLHFVTIDNEWNLIRGFCSADAMNGDKRSYALWDFGRVLGAIKLKNPIVNIGNDKK